MDPLQHDPKAKTQLRDAIYDFLYGPVMEKFQERLRKIVADNCRLTSYPHPSFIYRGVFHNLDTRIPTGKKNKLHPSLKDEMEEYLKDLREINEKEIPYVLGSITKVLNASDGLEDYLDMFPDMLHPLITDLIQTCPCRKRRLSPEKKEELVNSTQLNLIKHRIFANIVT